MKKHIESIEWDDYTDPDDVLDNSFFSREDYKVDIDTDVEDDEFYELDLD